MAAIISANTGVKGHAMTTDAWRYGRCLCGGVVYRVRAPLAPAHGCHCSLCRRQSGHFVVAFAAPLADVDLVEQRGLKWYASSAGAKRGFCGDCGSAMLWTDGAVMSIAAGSLDNPDEVVLRDHIFVDEKPSYYSLGDGLPCYAQADQPLEDG